MSSLRSLACSAIRRARPVLRPFEKQLSIEQSNLLTDEIPRSNRVPFLKRHWYERAANQFRCDDASAGRIIPPDFQGTPLECP